MQEDPIDKLINRKLDFYFYNHTDVKFRIIWHSEDKTIALVQSIYPEVSCKESVVSLVHFVDNNWKCIDTYPQNVSINGLQEIYQKNFKCGLDISDPNQILKACRIYFQKMFEKEIKKIQNSINRITAKKITPKIEKQKKYQIFSELFNYPHKGTP